MAASTGGAVSTGNDEDQSLWGAFGSLVLDVARTKYVDSEYVKSTNNIPDQNDLLHGANSKRNTLGTGISPAMIFGGIALLVVSVVVLKKVF